MENVITVHLFVGFRDDIKKAILQLAYVHYKTIYSRYSQSGLTGFMIDVTKLPKGAKANDCYNLPIRNWIIVDISSTGANLIVEVENLVRKQTTMNPDSFDLTQETQRIIGVSKASNNATQAHELLLEAIALLTGPRTEEAAQRLTEINDQIKNLYAEVEPNYKDVFCEGLTNFEGGASRHLAMGYLISLL